MQSGAINWKGLQGFKLISLFFLLYINDTSKSLLNSHTYLYTGNASIFCQNNDVTEIEDALSKEYVNNCEWFVDNNLSIDFGKDIGNCIFLSKDFLTYYNHKIKQYHIAEYINTRFVVLTLN